MDLSQGLQWQENLTLWQQMIVTVGHVDQRPHGVCSRALEGAGAQQGQTAGNQAREEAMRSYCWKRK